MRPRRAVFPDVDVRSQLAGNVRGLIDRYLVPLERDRDPAPNCPWQRELARIESGEPLVVPGWKLPTGMAQALGYGPNDLFVVESDGSISPVGLHHDENNIARFVRADGTEAPYSSTPVNKEGNPHD